MIGHFYELQNNFFLDSMFEMIQKEGVRRGMWTLENSTNHLFKDYESLNNKITKKGNESMSNNRFAILMSIYKKIDTPSESTLAGTTSLIFSEINLSFSVFSTKMNTLTLKSQNLESKIFGTNDLYLFVNNVISAFNQDCEVINDTQTAYMKDLYFNIDKFIEQKEIMNIDGDLIDSWGFVEFQKEIFSNNDAMPGDYTENEANTMHNLNFSFHFDKVRRKDVNGIFSEQIYEIEEFYPNAQTIQDMPIVNSTQPKYVNHPLKKI